MGARRSPSSWRRDGFCTFSSVIFVPCSTMDGESATRTADDERNSIAMPRQSPRCLTALDTSSLPYTLENFSTVNPPPWRHTASGQSHVRTTHSVIWKHSRCSYPHYMGRNRRGLWTFGDLSCIGQYGFSGAGDLANSPASFRCL